jgi:hypothetical protein
MALAKPIIDLDTFNGKVYASMTLCNELRDIEVCDDSQGHA